MSINIQGPESVLGLICSKTVCNWCNKPRGADVALKQCKGCTVTWYCSKECQTAAWPHHKLMCTSRSRAKVPPIYDILGRATMAELSQASKDWTEVHKLSLFMIATIAVELGGGVDAVLNAPQSVIFDLGPPTVYDGSPSTAFTLEAADFNHRDKVGALTAPQWSPPAVAVRDTLAQRFRGANAHPDIVGVLPVTFCIGGAQLAAQTSLPLHRGALDARTKAALENVTGICMGAINAGAVFRIPTDANRVVPDIGKLVLRGKNWTWTPPAPSVSQASNLILEFLRSHSEFRHYPVSPLDSFTTYHQLWPYHSLRIDAESGSS
ncbi:hypothetical protein LXA43DRAFT_1011323 [Ganoderma leucocontextum]|nr:hypothetical protein LXA43DRAFT_1011323 [Ganoderma leucocontextum]